MRETSKAFGRRMAAGWFRRFILGDVIDICCGDDPVTPWARRWDMEQGDAQELRGVAPASFDCVYVSHGLEHMRDPAAALLRWWEVLRPGGHLVVIVPDEDLYEQGVWPSRWNGDHKWTFTAGKSGPSWSPVSVNLYSLIERLPDHRLVLLETVDAGYDHRLSGVDQTLFGAEAAIEAVVRKGFRS